MWGDQPGQQFGSTDTVNPQDESFLHKIAMQGVVNPLLWMLESLGKPGYAVKGLLAGQGPSALANLIPFSDTLGITDPAQHVTGRDLARQWGLADQEDTWGNFLGGLGIDILTDPLTIAAAGPRAFSSAGLGALKTAEGVAPTWAGRIAAGQAGLGAVHTPFWWNALGLPEGRLALGTGETAQKIAGMPGQALDWASTNIPGIARARSVFEPGYGFTADPRIGNAQSGVVGPVSEAATAAIRSRGMEAVDQQSQAIQKMVAAGVARPAAEDAWSTLVHHIGEGSTNDWTDFIGGKNYLEPQNLYPGLSPTDANLLHSDIAPMALRTADILAGPGAAYESGREAARATGKIVGDVEKANPYRNYMSQASAADDTSLAGHMKARSVEPPTGAGAAFINQLAKDPDYTALYNKSAGTPFDQAIIDAKIEANAQALSKKELEIIDRELSNPTTLTPEKQAYLEKLDPAAVLEKNRGFAKFMAEINPQVLEEQRGFYRPDPAGNFIRYASNTGKLIGRAEGAQTAIAKLAEPASEALSKATNPNEFMRLGEALDELKLNATDTVPGQADLIQGGGRLNQLEKLNALGKSNLPVGPGIAKDLANEELNKFVIPRDVVENLQKEIAGPVRGSDVGFGPGINKATAAWRAFTLSFPATQVRQFGHNVFQQMLGGGLSASRFTDAEQFLRGAMEEGSTKAAEVADLAKRAMTQGAAFERQPMQLAGKSVEGLAERAITPFPDQTGKSAINSVKDWLADFKPSNVPGETYATLDPAKNIWIQRMMESNIHADESNRFAQFMGLVDKGYDDAAAARIVKQSQLDYTNMTPGLRKLQQIFPFGNFAYQNLNRFGRQLQDPGAIASTMRLFAGAGEGQSIPSYVNPSGAAIPIPGGEEGQQRYISGFNMPFEEPILEGLLSLPSGQFQQSARRMLEGINPLAKFAIEAGTGQQLYSGKPFNQTQPGPVASLGGILPNAPAQFIQQLISATPAGRLQTTLDRGFSGRDLNPLTNAFLGVRTTDVNTQQADKYAAEDALKQLLMGSGQARQSSDVYIPKAGRENVSPQMMYLYQLLGQLQRQKAQ